MSYIINAAKVDLTEFCKTMTQIDSLVENKQRNLTYLLGVFWFIMNLVASVFNDVIVKFVGLRLPFSEVAFFRFLFGTLSLVPLILYYGKSSLKTSRINVHIIRGVILFFAISMWSWGVNTVPITVVTIMGFTIPMFVLVLAPLFLKEKVSLELWLATLIGFVGVYVTLNPHHASFNPYSLVLILAALMFASLDIINKKFVVQETMIGMLFYSALVTTLLGAYPAYKVWVEPTAKEVMLLALLGVGSNLILYFILKAFTLVNASSLSPYRYLELVFSASIGYLLFAEVPHATTLIGCAIIVPANFYIAYCNIKARK
ncbi:hypothetical protein I862_07560 [endosymbiont of Acanthamoeba sp. UWC8]|uniref:DMT family transporter n=1 Tax=endosymbiont of Acanthamoeba sp. UWC8 TaxID=86106 RepID=UPI0004D0D7F3|nr:DMT family transporter [endosymbiont of Acanthamoeba sp. UWC8]AIF82066.1 hypothetical protein I862_07560 [endosymbiont of Acanthamoeba sp. UWC8]